MRAGIAFGSNLGDRLLMLRAGRSAVEGSALLGAPILASRVYVTSPVDCPPVSGVFYNAILEVELKGEPLALLRELRGIERGLGRTAGAGRNAPRTIDLDLLYACDCEMWTEELVLPHPGIGGRRFVLAPLAEIRPGLILPGQRETILELLERLPPGDLAEAIEETW